MKTILYYSSACFFLGVFSSLYADITTDGTMGVATQLSGPNFTVSQDLGTTKGQNLFHSFNTFSINQGQSAHFTGDSAIKNVVSRVTGSDISTINGVLTSDIGSQGFYFINPNGVVFGANASVDVPASFHVSTADKLKFSDGAEFNAVNPSASTLTMSAPSDFGFASVSNAKIQFSGTTFDKFKSNSQLTLSAHQIDIQNTKISIQSGNIKLESQGNQIINNSTLDVSGPGAGNFTIKGEDINITDSNLYNNNKGENAKDAQGLFKINAQSIIIDNSRLAMGTLNQNKAANFIAKVNANISLLNGGFIITSTFSQGDAGNVSVNANSMLIDGQGSRNVTGILSDANPSSTGGKAGTISITVDGLLHILNGGQIRSTTFSQGDAGKIKVNASSMLIDGQDSDSITGIFSDADRSSTGGNAGAISITVEDLLQILNAGQIRSATNSQGDAGNVTVNAGSMLIDRKDSPDFTGIATDAAGNSKGSSAGTINITVGNLLHILNGGQIRSTTFSQGNAGNITVNAGSMVIDGQGSDSITGILSDANRSSTGGKAGTIIITVDDLLRILNGGYISSATFSQGNAGNITVKAGSMLIDRQGSRNVTGILSDADPDSTGGNAGTISITVDDLLHILNGGQIRSSNFSQGDAGNVTVNASSMLIDKQDSSHFTGIVTDVASRTTGGNAGTISITVDDLLHILNGGQIRSTTFLQGNAGNITVNAGSMVIDEQGSILSDANRSSKGGNAGTIIITVDGLLQILNGGKVRSDTFSQGDAGNVTVNAGSMFIDGQGSFFTGISSDAASSSTGNAGNIIVNINGLLQLVNGATISITNDGNIGINKQTKKASINIQADELILSNTSLISAKSTGTANAANIVINTVNGLLAESGSVISSESLRKDAGEIQIRGGALLLNKGQITTSTGTNNSSNNFVGGDGGNIIINSHSLIMNDGFIQANTQGKNAKGGDIVINNKETITSLNKPIIVGGDRIDFNDSTGLNIIQAASAHGDPGDIQITPPNLDVVSGITGLKSNFTNLDKVNKNPCRIEAGEIPSSLTEQGRGALPDSWEEDIYPEFSKGFNEGFSDVSDQSHSNKLNTHKQNISSSLNCQNVSFIDG